jgi:hypothetical protein
MMAAHLDLRHLFTQALARDQYHMETGIQTFTVESLKGGLRIRC